MNIGTVKEIKQQEYRVGLTPDHVSEYRRNGHTVFVEKMAGTGSGFSDEDYALNGAILVDSAAEVYTKSDMVIKVKEPLASEYIYLRRGLILYAYLHLAADRTLTDALLASGTSGVAFETIERPNGQLPCLRPMSEIAGRLSVQEGAKYLEKPFGGKGILLGGVPGVERGKVVVLGGGVSGTQAAKIAVGLGAQVTIIDKNLNRLAEFDNIFGGQVTTLYSTTDNIRRAVAGADLVIGAVLIPGASAPKLLKRDMLRYMQKGSVIVDIAIDQGGCCETSRVTYHDAPTYEVDGIVHYCVGNMPGAVPRTSTLALANATLEYGLKIANLGLEAALASDPDLAKGLNTYQGLCTNREVAYSLGIPYTSKSFER